MIQSIVSQNKDNQHHFNVEKSFNFAKTSKIDIRKNIDAIKKRITPIWDLRDNVAVNPFFGFKDTKFLETLSLYESLLGSELLPPYSYFGSLNKKNELTDKDIDKALTECSLKYSSTLKISASDLKAKIDAAIEPKFLKIHSLCEVYDSFQNTNLTAVLKRTVSKWLSAYFDEGQSVWQLPTKEERLFSAWKQLAIYDDAYEKNHKGFAKYITDLPNDPIDTIESLSLNLVSDLNLDEKELQLYFLKLTTLLMGWTSYVHKYEFEAQRTGSEIELLKMGGFVDVLAIVMSYDSFFLTRINSQEKAKFKNSLDYKFDISNNIYKFLLLSASEINLRDSMLKSFDQSKALLPAEKIRPAAQLVFCIDVRSEVIRRHVESVGNFQTLGFAGFFGVPIDYKVLGATHSEQQCPVLLNPACEIFETSNSTQILKKRIESFQSMNLFKMLKSSINSCFTLVETFGWSYIFKLIKTNHSKGPVNINFELLGSKHKDEMLRPDLSTISLDQKVKLAFGALKNMGLTSNFSQLVFFMGHKSKTQNNPQSSALDCGACAGHSGISNARVLSGLLNDKEVRHLLNSKYELNIPADTCFVSGVHVTTTDEFEYDEYHFTQDFQIANFAFIKESLKVAQLKSTKERSKTLNYCEDLTDLELLQEINLKSRNWSEVQPEWALANNAAFIAGRRHLTKNVNLNSRAFLHEYDSLIDKDLSILELIMTAPMIVANWINMQYFVSAVNPTNYGSDDKALHNVVGQIGLMRGNGSDLLMGLSQQSLFNRDGQLMHQPVRLQVFIETAPDNLDSIIQKHSMVKELLDNDWLKLISIHPTLGHKMLYSSESWIRLN